MSAKKMFEVALVLTATDKATRIINDATVKAQKNIKGMSEMGDKAFGLGRGAAVTGTVLAGIFAAPLKAAADMESMNISLQTSFQGNQKEAKKAFDSINQFAAKTPYGLEEVMTGFIKLKNMGLDPSEEALTAYGNTASAMGKSLNDMVEAVADAATGEFERLKEFGIKASSQGDKVTFMFQGVKTTVGKNSKEIEQYLKYVGNVKFAGGIEAQSKSVNGMISTLKDGVVMAAAKIGTTFLPRLKEIINRITPVIDKISIWVGKNPQLTETIIKAVGAAALLSFTISGLAFVFGGLFKAISFGMSVISGLKTMMIAFRAGQMAYTFSLLAGTGATGAMTAALTAMNLAFLANPITWVILGIIALIGVGYLLIKNWDKVKAFFVGLWDYVKGVFHRAMEMLNKTFLKYSPFVMIYNNWSKITAFFSGLWDKVKAIFMTVLGWIKNFYKPFFEFGANIISGVWNGIKAKVEPLYNFVKGVGKKIADVFKYVLGIASPSKVFMDFGVNIAEGASKGIQKGAGGVKSASAGMAKSLTPTAGSKGGGGGSSVSVTFAPVINGGSGGDITQQMKAMIPELIRQIEDSLARKQRLSY